MSDRLPDDARLDALFQAAREAPVPAAPPFERLRRSRAASPRWPAAWVLLPLVAGAAVGSYVTVRRLNASRPLPAAAPLTAPPRANHVEPLPPPPAPEPIAEVAPAVAAPVVHPKPPVAARVDDRPAPKPEVPAGGGPIEALTPPPAPPPSSTLAEQSKLVADGFAALKAHHPADARARFDDYRQRFPGGLLEAEALIGSIRADQALGHYAQALDSIEQALSIAPERRAELLVLEGELSLADGRLERARDAFDRALLMPLPPELVERATRGRAAVPK
ncbi:MAG: hypothetical protein QM723_34010 [Myxococcaceae bacterium]